MGWNHWGNSESGGKILPAVFLTFHWLLNSEKTKFVAKAVLEIQRAKSSYSTTPPMVPIHFSMIPQISVSILLLTKMLEKRYLRKRSITLRIFQILKFSLLISNLIILKIYYVNFQCTGVRPSPAIVAESWGQQYPPPAISRGAKDQWFYPIIGEQSQHNKRLYGKMRGFPPGVFSLFISQTVCFYI